ncbi:MULTISPECIES: cation transporter [Halomonas]|uniref:Cation transporter n=1 Tax=Halomonas flagellata TaxID=2920385 RepID=A0ABS9RRY7_9GAMM|nr:MULTISPECIES: cation transporter [Halomonas]MCH4562576.1 cation transporter [Halomonas flagellata]PXX97229.1 hypothetical protein CR157_10785 [Halomonas sp. LBP4]
MKDEHRLGVSEVTCVSRHLKLEPCDHEQLQAAIGEIDGLYGIDRVTFDDKKHTLDLAYDASRLCLDCIEEILTEHGVKICHDWWTRFKEEHYRFVDQNIQDNARHEPWSCHGRPSGTGGRTLPARHRLRR